MADQKRRRRQSGEQRPSSDAGKEPSRRGGLSGAKAAARARDELSEITGLESESVISLERQDGGSWKVAIEMLELSRVPETDDLLGNYQVDLDETGELLGYRRLSRYARSQKQDE